MSGFTIKYLSYLTNKASKWNNLYQNHEQKKVYDYDFREKEGITLKKNH